MEMVVKFSREGPSRIGIRYIYEFQAVKAYEELIRAHKDGDYEILCELKGKRVQLTLRSRVTGLSQVYRDLDFKPAQLQQLHRLFEAVSLWQFVHVYPKASKLLVAKPFHRQQFLVVSRFGMIGADNFSDVL